jgi:hypothetical protein
MNTLTPATMLLVRPEVLKAQRDKAFADAEAKATAIRKERYEAKQRERVERQVANPHLTQTVLSDDQQLLAALFPQDDSK